MIANSEAADSEAVDELNWGATKELDWGAVEELDSEAVDGVSGFEVAQ